MNLQIGHCIANVSMVELAQPKLHSAIHPIYPLKQIGTYAGLNVSGGDIER